MSELVRHKMIDFAVEPPPAAWDSIAERLDDDRKYFALATKMSPLETPVPAAVWEKLGARLSDDGQYAALSTKMNHFEASPPPQLWDQIAASLNETVTEPGIVTSPVISIRKMLYRALAAAVVIGLVLGGWLITNNSNVATELVKNNPTHLPVPAANAEDKNTIPDNSSSTQAGQSTVEPVVPEDLAAPHANSRTADIIARATNDGDRILKYAVVNSIPAFHEGPIVISSAPILDANGLVIRDIDVLTTNSNYIMVTGPNGQQTRISSKFASVIRYLNGSTDDTEEYIDKVIKESDTWKKRFQEWRSKISQSSFIPSSANFLDIIEFKELIQE
jgi:hypothetical protein